MIGNPSSVVCPDCNRPSMTREELAQALTEVAGLLQRVWRGEVTSPSIEVGSALDRYLCHPSHLLADGNGPQGALDA